MVRKSDAAGCNAQLHPAASLFLSIEHWRALLSQMIRRRVGRGKVRGIAPKGRGGGGGGSWHSKTKPVEQARVQNIQQYLVCGATHLAAADWKAHSHHQEDHHGHTDVTRLTMQL